MFQPSRRLDLARLEALLPYVKAPAQYIGGEINQLAHPERHADPAVVRWGLCFPDSYAIGMSHQGIKILYQMLNERPDALAERVFAPWPDMEQAMRKSSLPMFTWETHSFVKDLDILGFTLLYELCYTNILTVLDLAGIPLRREDRSDADPIILAGGHCANCPEPISDFVDLFCIGEGEEVLYEINALVKAGKAAGLPRREIIERLAREVRGLYAPHLYDVTHSPCGRVEKITPREAWAPHPVERRWVADFENAPAPVAPVIPWTDIVHDRIAIEIMRGCTNGCRFCQAGMITRPQRQRSADSILRLAEQAYANTGQEEIGLLSLSSSDYLGIRQLAEMMSGAFTARNVNISLPSLRIKTVVSELPAALSTVRKGGLTLAPEAASERMRKVINKPVLDEDLFAGVIAAYKLGYEHVKLYFQIGMPTETDDDVERIVTLAEEVSMLRQTVLGLKPARVTASASIFVPKVGTPFQWEPQIDIPEMKRRTELLHRKKKLKSVKLQTHDPEQSYLEAVFSRGDRRLGRAIETAWRNGARFDGWGEQFNFARWMEAFRACGLDPLFYNQRERSTEEILPWAMVSPGVSERFLALDRSRAFLKNPRTVPTCAHDGPCFLCDACERSPNHAGHESYMRDWREKRGLPPLPAKNLKLSAANINAPANRAAAKGLRPLPVV
ncbi:MAG: TIGR03960 family B12-binding radical SAM protein [Planctomycetota bacterium]